MAAATTRLCSLWRAPREDSREGGRVLCRPQVTVRDSDIVAQVGDVRLSYEAQLPKCLLNSTSSGTLEHRCNHEVWILLVRFQS